LDSKISTNVKYRIVNLINNTFSSYEYLNKTNIYYYEGELILNFNLVIYFN
jgi:hypothetical protein